MKTYLKDLRWGKFNLIEGDMISTIAAYYGEWAEAEVALFKLLLTPNSNVIEVGSNIGMHSVPLAKIVHQGKVICFEPQRVIYQQLCCNLSLNNITNVESYRFGVSDRNTQTSIESCDYSQPWNYGGFSIEKGFSAEDNFTGKISKEDIEIIKLDNFMPIQRLDSIDLLKIDAEGFDLNVLIGAAETIKRTQPTIFIEANLKTANAILTCLNQMNYDAYWILSKRYQATNFNQVPELDGTSDDINLLAIPKWKTEQNRTEQNRTEQNRTEQNRTEQNRTELFYLLSQLKKAESADELNYPIPTIEAR